MSANIPSKNYNFEIDLAEKVGTILDACLADDYEACLLKLFAQKEYQSVVWKVVSEHLWLNLEEPTTNDNVFHAAFYCRNIINHLKDPQVAQPAAPPTSSPPVPLEEENADPIELTRIWHALRASIRQKPDESDADNLFIWLEQNREALSQVDSLDLSRQALTSLPRKLFDYLPNLVSLKLDGNRLNALPDEFFNLNNLRTLTLRCNPLPEGVILLIGQRLPQLESFSFTEN